MYSILVENAILVRDVAINILIVMIGADNVITQVFEAAYAFTGIILQ